MTEHTLEDVRDAIRLMRQRLESGQGRADQAMCRLSLSMSEFLLARIDEREDDMHVRIRHGYDKTVADCWRARVAELECELERWRHGAPVEGDYVCPNEYEAAQAKAALKELKENLHYLFNRYDHLACYYNECDGEECAVRALDAFRKEHGWDE